MDTYKFLYSSKDGTLSSVRVSFSDFKEDSILISQKYLEELRKYKDISENDTALFSVIAHAIQLKKENNRKIAQTVEKYDFGNKYYPFYTKFISKLMSVLRYISIDKLEIYFGEEAKIEDLDIFLNQKDPYDFALHICESPYCNSEIFWDDDEILE